MNNAIWLLLATPGWYFSTILAPLSAGLFTAIPALGVLCLLAGVVLSVIRRRKGTLLFLIPFAASQAFVGLAGAMRGQFRTDESGFVLLAFVTGQLVLAVYLVWRLKGARVPAVLLALFSLSYALFAAFVAGMALTDNWL